jgi:uncharacterized coiled-coil protein SlyX
MGSLSNLYISQSYQSLIHLATNNTASATLIDLQDGLGNSIGVSVNTGGDLSLSGSFTASLQQGYLYVGGANGKTYTVATSSIATNVDTSSLVTTASFNQYTSSTNNRLNNLESTSASVNVSISNLNSTTASQAVSITNLNAYTSSNDSKVNQLINATASYAISSSVAAVDAAQQLQIDSLISATSSYITESETGSFARTNVDNNFTANQTFTNITATSASITYLTTLYETSSVIYSSGSNQFGDELTDIQTLSGSVKIQGGLTINGVDITGSLNNLNTFTSSTNSSISQLNTFTSSTNSSISQLNTFTSSASSSISQLNQSSASQQISINAINAVSNSWVTESETGSFVKFIAATANPLEFYYDLANGSSNNVTLVAPTGSTINTGSFATTGSNSFVGNEEITGSLIVTYPGNTGNPLIEANSSSLKLFAAGNFPLQIGNFNGNIDIFAGGGSPYNTLNVNASINQDPTATYSNQNNLQTTKIWGSLTASLQEGYAWVGNSSNVSVLVATSSFGGGTIIDTGSFATTGSNTFTGFNIFEQQVDIKNSQALVLKNGGPVDYGLVGLRNTSGSLEIVSLGSGKRVDLQNLSLLVSGTFTASLQEGYVWVGDSSGKTTTVSTSSFGSTINTGSLVTTSSFNAYTASNDQRVTSLEANSASVNTSITNINSATSSLFGSASLGLTTASFNNGTRNLTFTKGDASTFSVNIPDVSGSAGDFVTTSSFNAYTSSNDQRVSSLETATASLFTSASLAIVTASVNNDDITFTKGDGSTFTIQVATGSFAISASYAETASFALNGGVTQILAGPNITVSPLSGQGQVTISSTGTGSGGFNTATGSYGSFYDTTIQTNPVANSANSMSFNETAITNGVSISGSTSPFNTYIKTENAGVYNLQFSAQLDKTDSGTDSVDIWIRKNGIDLLDTGTTVTLTGNNDKSVAAWNWFVQSAANDYYQIIWSSADTDMRLLAEVSSSVHPGIPSVIATVNRVDQFLSNTGSFSGSFTGTFNGYNLTEFTTTSSFNLYTSSNDQKVNSLIAATGSYATTGSNTFTGDQTLIDNGGNFFTITDTSGSMMLVGKSYTSASAHLSSSVPSPSGSQLNLIFKTNNFTPDTIISGSNNIFTNPAAPGAGFKRYIGGSNNIINTLNAPQISGSMQFSPGFDRNYIAGLINMRGPVSSSAWNISLNNILGPVSIGNSAANNAEKLVSGLTLSTNTIPGTLNVVANQAFLTSSVNISTNTIGGGATLNLNSSSITFTNNIVADIAFTLTNNYYTSSLGFGAPGTNRNLIIGTANTMLLTGISDTGVGVALQPAFNNNILGGTSNTLFINATSASTSNQLQNTIIYGNTLIVTGSSNNSTTNGSAFFGRYNANDGRRNSTAGTIFAVGTGTAAGARKTGFLIDSGSNTFVEGTFNVSGSSTFTGSVTISGSLLVNGNSVSIDTGSFATTGSNSFNGNQRITGSLTMSGSILFVDRSGNNTNTYLGLNALGMGLAGGQPLALGNTISVAIGNGAMRFASGSSQNVAIGNNALLVTSGSNNFALGSEAMANNITGNDNVAIGLNGLNSNTTGTQNVAIGNNAGFRNNGGNNTYIGDSAGYNITGSNNTIVGRYQGSTGQSFSNNIILADGQGNVKAQYSGSAWSFQDEIKLNVGANKPAGQGSATTDGAGLGTFTNSLITTSSIVLLSSLGSYSIWGGACSAGSMVIASSLGSSGVSFNYLIINPTA